MAKRRTRQISCMLTNEEHVKFVNFAYINNISVSELFRESVREYIEKGNIGDLL